MKRIILTLSCIISVVWFMPLFVKADTTYSAEMQYVIDYCAEHWPNITFDNGTKDYIDLRWVDAADLFFRVYDNRFIIYIGGPFNNTSTGVNNSNGNSYYTTHGNDNGVGSSGSSMFNFNYSSLPDGIGMHFFGTRAEVQESLIDYDTLYYSPLIPKVDFSVVLNSGSSVGSVSSEQNLFNVNINSDVGNDYYIQILYKTHVPYKILVGVNNNGSPYYSNVLASVSTDNIYTLQDNQVAFSGNLNSDLFTWERIEVQDSNFSFIDALAGQTSFQTNAKNLYNNRMSYLMPLYGKKLEIFMRYFVIQDGSVIVGQWTHWNNTYPSQYTEELPENYIDYHYIPGYEQTSSNVNLQEQSDTIQSIGTPTGTQGNVIVNNNVPNYPDYPTVALYNHDNILLKFFDTANQLPSLFNGFTNFLSASLTWIPSYIWDIIAFGLLASITVMIIKIL